MIEWFFFYIKYFSIFFHAILVNLSIYSCKVSSHFVLLAILFRAYFVFSTYPFFIDNSWYQLRWPKLSYLKKRKKKDYADRPKVSLNTFSYLSWQISFLVLVDKETYLDNSWTFIISFQPKGNEEQQNRCVVDWTSPLLYKKKW